MSIQLIFLNLHGCPDTQMMLLGCLLLNLFNVISNVHWALYLSPANIKVEEVGCNFVD